MFRWMAGAAAMSALFGCSASAPTLEAAASTKTLKPVEVATATLAADTGQVEISGTLAAYREAVVSADVGETIVFWPWLEGDRLREGQVISRQDDRALQAQVSEVAAQAAQARAEVGRLKAEYSRLDLETSAGILAAQSGVRSAQANLAKIGTITRSQELRQAEARLAQAGAEEALARKEFDRYTLLVQSGAASQQTLDQVRARFDVASQSRISAEQGVSLAREGSRAEDRSAAAAGVQQAQAVLEAARSRPSRLAALRSAIKAAEAQAAATEAALRRTQILLAKHVKRAPFSGRVLETNAELGMTVAPGTPLLTLGETARLKLRFSAPERLRSNFDNGTVRFSVPSLGLRSFRATVRARGFQADPRTRTFNYEAVLLNPGETLLPGMVARVTLTTRTSNSSDPTGVSVPLGALIMDGTSATIYVLNSSSGGDRVEVRRVLVVKREGQSAIVERGLRPGERVVVNPKNLADGESVKVVTP